MNTSLETVSPFASWLFSFIDSNANDSVKILISGSVYWFLILMPTFYLMEIVERKISANIQMRLGPNRVGPRGFFQGLSDQIKLLTKAINTASDKNEKLKYLPIIVLIILFLASSLVPVATQWQIADIESSGLFIVLTLLLTKLFLFWFSYSSSSRFAELTAYRITFDLAVSMLPIIATFITIFLVVGSIDLNKVVQNQGGAPWRWNILHNPGAFIAGITFYISILIWSFQSPFGLSKNSVEISGGLNEQQSGIDGSQIKLIEKMSLYFGLTLFVVLFLGAGKAPFSLEYFGKLASLIEFFIFSIKLYVVIILAIWIKSSLPEMKSSQITGLVFLKIVPMSLLSIFLTIIWMAVFSSKGIFQLL